MPRCASARRSRELRAEGQKGALADETKGEGIHGGTDDSAGVPERALPARQP
jgi:hypothetical protein